MIYAEVTATPKTLPGCSSQLSASAASSSVVPGAGATTARSILSTRVTSRGSKQQRNTAAWSSTGSAAGIGASQRATSNRDSHAITRPADAAHDDTKDRRALTQQPRPWSEAIRKQAVSHPRLLPILLPTRRTRPIARQRLQNGPRGDCDRQTAADRLSSPTDRKVADLRGGARAQAPGCRAGGRRPSRRSPARPL
jgi:hypothetical protein